MNPNFPDSQEQMEMSEAAEMEAIHIDNKAFAMALILRDSPKEPLLQRGRRESRMEKELTVMSIMNGNGFNRAEEIAKEALKSAKARLASRN